MLSFLMNFFTAYLGETEIIKDKKTIAKNYLSGHFFTDLLGTLPGLLVGENPLYPKAYYFQAISFRHVPLLFETYEDIIRRAS